MDLKTLGPTERGSSFPKPEKGKGLSLPDRVFKFFASLKLAVFLLVSLMAVLAAGTFIESWHGADAARILIYQSPAFGVLLFLLATNLAAAALDRLPWKVKHIGFVITHAGIILILAGSWLTQQKMIDGQMPIAEGDSEQRITVNDPMLYIYSEEQDRNWLIPLKREAFAWKGSRDIRVPEGAGLPLAIRLLAHYPKARLHENLMPAAEGPAALQVTLKSSFVNQSVGLIENDPDRGDISLGPAKLKFTDQLLKESKTPAPEKDYLEFQFENTSTNIPLPPGLKVPASFPIEGTPYTIEITRLLKKAAVRNNELVDLDGAANIGPNPAAELTLSGPGISEKHSVFANFPDFPTMHGLKPSSTGVHIFYRMPGGGSRGEAHELRFVKQGEKLLYQVKSGTEIKTGEVKTGEEVALGWMDMIFKVTSFYPHAVMNRNFTPESNISESEEVSPAVRIFVGSPDAKSDQSTFWLQQNVDEKQKIGGDTYHFVFGQKRITAGFKLQLRDFRMEKYPGTDKPASFESDVTLTDIMNGTEKKATVSMNNPLVYHGYRIYQSGYISPEEQGTTGPEISVFAIGKDPGVPLKYAGAIITVLGVITMFYTRKFSSTAGRMI